MKTKVVLNLLLRRQRHETFSALVRDDRGNVGWISLILMTSVIAIGMIAGLTTYRDHVVQQFGDAAVGVRNFRQSYSYQIQIDANRNGVLGEPEDCVLQGSFTDAVDLQDTAGDEPACMNLLLAPTGEGN